MWDYSDKVREHFFNPRNSGPLDGANGTGDFGSIKCGDALRLMLRVNPETEVIDDARFQTFGCGSAIASSSALTEIIKGKTLDEALRVSNQDIADYLDGLPPEKMHCSVMGREALQAAVADYRGESWKDDHEEGELICKCFAIDTVMIEDTVRANSLRTIEEVANYTKAGGGCSACHEKIEDILIAVNGRLYAREVKPTRAPVASSGTPDMPKLTNYQRIRRIEETLEEIRPLLQREHGDVTLVEIDGRNIYVELSGACQGCAMQAATLGGVQQKLSETLGELVQVLPIAPLVRA
ncbi:Fe-S cluster assembly protein NifU [Accumulibacter sp.]|uniref:Fe-S cluster assembly protein NifU n=1 Tax=Accumulibacter sp. TaxID=2053492 RepID=UPI0025E03861|nr:Fe-S cluster assembly protein NifU [Accumulibacter sp.]MCM8611857.1 Fe-S cluster assembly protein NifU [Accumulibacter sp.]MCM8635479.1 Fe-S cluster assembly protein NifU [Accumulibacter sp.]MCM8639057.1 Fe-S cluster assembly protein NifU [Accumulibacter sp.]